MSKGTVEDIRPGIAARNLNRGGLGCGISTTIRDHVGNGIYPAFARIGGFGPKLKGVIVNDDDIIVMVSGSDLGITGRDRNQAHGGVGVEIIRGRNGSMYGDQFMIGRPETVR